jgi:hypothetical protein
MNIKRIQEKEKKRGLKEQMIVKDTKKHKNKG